MTSTVYLGLGGNVGDRLANLREGLCLLAIAVQLREVSPLYETDPIGVIDQPPFYNAVCRVQTALDPEALLDSIKEIEHVLGRRPGPVWGPRPLDIDILIYEQAIYASERLVIPHPRLSERAFVLRPLADLDSRLIVPGLGKSVEELFAAVDATGVRRVAEAGWGRKGASREARSRAAGL